MKFRSAALVASLACIPAAAAPLAAPSLSPGQDIRQESGEVTVNGVPRTVVRYTWRDSGGFPRSVALVPAPVGQPSGYAVQMTYTVNAGAQTVTLDSDPGLPDGGFGYFVSHELFRNFSNGGQGTIAGLHGEDDSPLGRYLASTGTTNTVGSTQAVHEYRLTYPRWGTLNAVLDPDAAVPVALNQHQRFDLPVTIRWSFVAGFDHPLWSVEYLLNAAVGKIANDVRGPYGVMRFNEGVGPDVTALRWGDWYHFVADADVNDFSTQALDPAGIAWTWNTGNAGRRYNVLSSGNYEFGIVDTVAALTSPYADGYSPSRKFTRASAPSCAGDGDIFVTLPCAYEWPYQSFQYDAGPPARPKIAWGSSPYLGSGLSSVYVSDVAPQTEPLNTNPRVSYGVHLVMGKQGTGAPITRARAAAPPEPNKGLIIASSPPAGGSIAYDVLGPAAGPYGGSASFPAWSSIRLVATEAPGYTFSSWSGACAGVSGNVCLMTLDDHRSVTANFIQGVSAGLQLTPTTFNFGMWPMTIAATPQPVTVTNMSASTVTVSSVGTTGPFTQTNNCSTLAAGASCTVTVTFQPPVVVNPALQASEGLIGSLVVTSNAPGSPNAATLSGGSERSLLTHYYRFILRRDPDLSGAFFWRTEIPRVAGLGANVNEAWFAMAQAFFGSAEYAAFNRDDAGFVTDLYRTFFSRAPDAPGLSFWSGQIAQGMPREVVLAAFLFSNEFVTFTQGIFGNTAARAEIDVTMDFYRGLLARLPDSGGFNFWVGQFRTAQCPAANPALAVQQAESISAAFVNSGEYAARNRSNGQFVGDLYNAFLRRGGDLGGVQFWISQLNAGGLTRDQVRAAFRGSSEFAARANAIAAQGCAP